MTLPVKEKLKWDGAKRGYVFTNTQKTIEVDVGTDLTDYTAELQAKLPDGSISTVPATVLGTKATADFGFTVEGLYILQFEFDLNGVIDTVDSLFIDCYPRFT